MNMAEPPPVGPSKTPEELEARIRELEARLTEVEGTEAAETKIDIEEESGETPPPPNPEIATLEDELVAAEDQLKKDEEAVTVAQQTISDIKSKIKAAKNE
jgi:chromosome segregation ATPase